MSKQSRSNAFASSLKLTVHFIVVFFINELTNAKYKVSPTYSFIHDVLWCVLYKLVASYNCSKTSNHHKDGFSSMAGMVCSEYSNI